MSGAQYSASLRAITARQVQTAPAMTPGSKVSRRQASSAGFSVQATGRRGMWEPNDKQAGSRLAATGVGPQLKSNPPGRPALPRTISIQGPTLPAEEPA